MALLDVDHNQDGDGDIMINTTGVDIEERLEDHIEMNHIDNEEIS